MEGEIEAERFSPKLREFDGLLSSFACELLTIGYSKRYLYKFFNSFKKNRRGLSFEDAFSEMKLKFTELKQLSFYVVITVNYNNLKGLKRTISSVLSQSFSDFEYIIVDGGSSDGSKEYIESKREYINQWVSEKDHGVYNAMNKAIRMAQGEYCIFMNSVDHFFSSQSLENAAKMLNG